MLFWDMTSDGSIYMVLYEELEDTPDEDGIVRMRLPIGGVHFEPVPGNPNKTKTTLVLEADL
jgi:hypothetical protein